MRGTAVCFRTVASSSGLPLRLGAADRTSAATPTTCGVAMLVPLNADEYEFVGTLERIWTPGAVRSGFSSPESVGPRDEKYAMLSFESVAPTVSTLGKLPGASDTVPQVGPAFPAAATTR